MLKRFLLIVTVAISLGLNAQVSKTDAIDFTATDYNGNEIHLFEILEQGQYVLIHFNITSSDETPKVTPPLVDAYTRLGCNLHDVFFIGIIPNGTSSLTKKYIDEYGIEFPMIHSTDESFGMEGPAIDIWMKYSCELPTTILIDPDKKIVLQDINPMKTSQNIIDALKPFGIEEHKCGEDDTDGCEELVNNDFNIYPNPASSEINIMSAMSGEAMLNIYDMTGRCVKNININDVSNATINISDIEKGIYIVDVNGHMTKLVVE